MAGQIVHFEVPAGDPDRAVAFWSGLFGVEVGPSVMPDFTYRMFQATPDQGGAIMSSDQPGSGIVTYHGVEDIDTSVARVRELGGTADEKQAVPTHGWFSSCVDTEGNKFSLWQRDPNAA
jgi:predicted enzyme related to lactoylglutathione lyase